MVICEGCSKEVFVYSSYGSVLCLDCKVQMTADMEERVIKRKCSCCRIYKKIYYTDNYFYSKYPLIQLCLSCSQDLKLLKSITLLKEYGSEYFRICQECSNLFEYSEDKSWSKICLDCWIKGKNGIEFQEESFSDFQNLTPIQKKCMDFLDLLSIEHVDLKVCHMSKDNFEEDEIYNYYNPKYNTRYILDNEICIEVEWKENNLENQNKGITATTETCLNLINAGVKFSVWYSNEMKTPHIRIHEIKELGETKDPLKKKLIRQTFSKKFVPFVYHAQIDSSLFSRHKIQLEYANHWKYGTPFEMLFEVGN
jgi:hypothetical protein